MAEIDDRLRGRLALDKTPYLYMLRMPLNEAVALDGAEMGRGGLSCYMRDYRRRRAKPRFKWRGWGGVARPRYSVRSRQIIRLLHFACAKNISLLLVQRLESTRKFKNRATFKSDNALRGRTT